MQFPIVIQVEEANIYANNILDVNIRILKYDKRLLHKFFLS